MWWWILTGAFALSALLFARENGKLRWRLNDMAGRAFPPETIDAPNLCSWCTDEMPTCGGGPIFASDRGLSPRDDRVVQCRGYRFCTKKALTKRRP
jgi:hypothetical protein